VTILSKYPSITASVAEPEVAVIVAVPSAIEVTRPEDEAVATAASDVAHVTVAPLIVPPFWSLTVAEIWDVAPSEAKLRLASERVIDVATGVGVGVDAVGLLSPPQLHKNSENTTAPNATVLFMPEIAPPHSGPQLRTRRTLLDSWCGWVPRRGGLTGKADISLEMGPTAHLWLTHGPLSRHGKSPTTT